ncbi:MAG: AI-2E family transporter [Elusimicrobia bacterium]|nr:AI-2E family transporter [Elusimicrobiota bacterium]MDE2236878.1 AI-2E family transporter [Elusimicrobiota bacterium]MDE2426078.1 AI-2E family transporter [Elusimicrobiota bacterium]
MTPRRFPWAAALVALALAGLAVHYLLAVLIPFALGCAAAYVLNPLAALAEARGLRRRVVVPLAYLLTIAALALLAGRLLPSLLRQVSSLRGELPSFMARLRLDFLELQRQASLRLPFAADAISRFDPVAALAPMIARSENIPSYLLSAFPLLSLLFLVPFISFFLLLDGPDSIDRLIQRCPSRYVEQALHLLSEIDHSLGSYLRGLVVVVCVLSAVSYAGLLLLGVHQALWIALLSGVSSVVPYLGAVVGMVVGGLAAGFQFGTVAAGLKVVVLFALIRLGDEVALEPYIAQHTVRLHPLVFLFAFLAGGELFGFIGLIFAVPAACVVKALFEVAWSWYSSEARLLPAGETNWTGAPYT